MFDSPIRFRPLIKQAIWGGRRLHTSLGKEIGEASDYAESWEVVDHGEDQSVVVDGPLAGKTLGELVREHTRDLMGGSFARLAGPDPAFPLLFKFLDCNRVLSVQVHPNDEQGAKLSPPDLGKTEAWVILHSEPESVIYAGLKTGVDREALAKHIEAGTTEEALHAFHPAVGDCIFIPAGTVHALGGGLLVAEIQQSSNTTFRLFDWNRTDASGNTRPLHIEQSLDVTDYDRGPVHPVVPSARAANGYPTQPDCETLVECDKFDLKRISGNAIVGTDDRCELLSVIAGHGELVHQQQTYKLVAGETILLPASMSAGQWSLADGGTALWMSPTS